MSDAESTVKFAIFNATISNWDKKSHPKFAEILRDAVFKRIFEPHLRWAIEEYLEELKNA